MQKKAEGKEVVSKLLEILSSVLRYNPGGWGGRNFNLERWEGETLSISFT